VAERQQRGRRDCQAETQADCDDQDRAQRAIERTCRRVAPTSPRSPSSRRRRSAIIASVLTTAIDVNPKIIRTTSGPSQRLISRSASCGLRRGSRAAHRRALRGWDSLTPTESDVVRLTVEGLTNRQIGERLFISRRTVQTHLGHAFTKLEVASRVELAAAAQRHAAA